MASPIKKFALVVIAMSGFIAMTQGYGFRYRFDPYTRQTHLWSYVPGMQNPTVYDNNLIVQTTAEVEDNPGLYMYTGPNGKPRWRCKVDAYYSEFFNKCIWKPEHYNRNRF